MIGRLWRLLFVLIVVGMAAMPSSAQDEAVTAPRWIEHFVIPQGQSDVRISDRDKISPQVMELIRRADCRLDHVLQERSIHVFRPATSRMMALVPCFGIAATRSIALTFLHPGNEPRLMVFPVMSYPDGIGLTHMPGFLEWNAESNTLTAILLSDMCPDLARRYIYRHQNLGSREGAPLSWVLLKTEIAKNACGSSTPQGWITYWEAPEFPELPKPN